MEYYCTFVGFMISVNFKNLEGNSNINFGAQWTLKLSDVAVMSWRNCYYANSISLNGLQFVKFKIIR